MARADATPRKGNRRVAAALAFGTVALAIFVAEQRRPLRARTGALSKRRIDNVALGALSMAVIQMLETPATSRLTAVVERHRFGLVQRLSLPALARDALAFLLLDYSMYLWHVATHRVPVLWRLHLVHHVDLHMDATTALRFHAVDMMLSTPLRIAQITAIGVSPRALSAWQAFFFASVLFHHSNVELPIGLERMLARVLTTPRMHGIHHTAVFDRTDSNWSSGLSFWDHFHGSFRLDVPQSEDIGVPAYPDAREIGVARSLKLPFGPQRDDWSNPIAAGALIGSAPEEHRHEHRDPVAVATEPRASHRDE